MSKFFLTFALLGLIALMTSARVIRGSSTVDTTEIVDGLTEVSTASDIDMLGSTEIEITNYHQTCTYGDSSDFEGDETPDCTSYTTYSYISDE
mmetsp:Transcript_12458/g.17567  ORF Transcript_12458/g.17567 Transcript_12458/m.17567 type:complete len:93 (-) Transcript_12458:117-395(-)